MNSLIIGASHLLNDCLRANHPHAIDALDLFLSTLPIVATPMATLEAVSKTFAPWQDEVPDGWRLFQHRLALRRESDLRNLSAAEKPKERT